MSVLWVSILSSTVISAVVAGLFNLRSMRNEYVNDYYRIEPPRLLRRLFVESHAAKATDSC